MCRQRNRKVLNFSSRAMERNERVLAIEEDSTGSKGGSQKDGRHQEARAGTETSVPRPASVIAYQQFEAPRFRAFNGIWRDEHFRVEERRRSPSTSGWIDGSTVHFHFCLEHFALYISIQALMFDIPLGEEYLPTRIEIFIASDLSHNSSGSILHRRAMKTVVTFQN
jgi:hypothetical protein